jgi:sialate O-acetylesterase
VWFGIAMHGRTKVPQGLIATAHGGTSMREWDPALRARGGDSLYGSMLESLRAVGQPLAGVLWYQGCSDANGPDVERYVERMRALVAAIRADQRQPKLPFVVAQIGRSVRPDGGGRAWNAIQESQRLLPASIPRLGVVPAVDLELDDFIHISTAGHAKLAQRMARIAAMIAHGDRRARPGPEPVSARLIDRGPLGPAIEVRFRNVVGGLRSEGLPRGFSLVDHQHQHHESIYQCRLDGDRAILGLVGDVRRDVRLMYGWGRDPVCTIGDARGMALPVFGPMRILAAEPTR